MGQRSSGRFAVIGADKLFVRYNLKWEREVPAMLKEDSRRERRIVWEEDDGDMTRVCGAQEVVSDSEEACFSAAT